MHLSSRTVVQIKDVGTRQLYMDMILIIYREESEAHESLDRVSQADGSTAGCRIKVLLLKHVILISHRYRDIYITVP